MTDQEQEPWQEPWPEKMYLLHPSIKTFGAMVSNPERREYVRADRIEELVEELDISRMASVVMDNTVEELEAKLAKAVEALQKCLDYFEQVEIDFGPLRCGDTVRAALAELEGK